jgi:ketosteroid isomerase-like protein
MKREEFEALLEEGIAAWNAAGVRNFGPYLTEDVELRTPKEIPGGGTFNGRQAALDFLASFEEGGGGVRLRFEVAEVIETGDQFFVALKAAQVGDSSGIELGEGQWFYVMRMRGRAVDRFQTFLDRDEALAAAGLKS